MHNYIENIDDFTPKAEWGSVVLSGCVHLVHNTLPVLIFRLLLNR